MTKEAITRRDLEDIFEKKFNTMYSTKLAPLLNTLEYSSKEYNDLKKTVTKQQSGTNILQLENNALKSEIGKLNKSFGD